MKRFLAVSLVTAALAFQAHANFIDGSMTMVGEFQLLPPNANTANFVVNTRNNLVMTPSGDFSPLVPPVSSFTVNSGFSVNPYVGPSPLWVAGPFSFLPTSSELVTQANDVFAFRVYGNVIGAGYDPTPFVWKVTTQEPPSAGWWSWSGSLTRHSVPDGGFTLSLLGMAFASLGFIARRRRL